MKRVYNVSYDLNKIGKDYTGLHAELKRTPGYYHLLGSTWLLATTETASQIFDRLRFHIDSNDNILIAEITKNNSGWLPTAAWKWISENLPQLA